MKKFWEFISETVFYNPSEKASSKLNLHLLLGEMVTELLKGWQQWVVFNGPYVSVSTLFTVLCCFCCFVVAHGLSSCGSWASLLRSMWDLSSLTRDRTCFLCIAKQFLNYWTMREVPAIFADNLPQVVTGLYALYRPQTHALFWPTSASADSVERVHLGWWKVKYRFILQFSVYTGKIPAGPKWR